MVALSKEAVETAHVNALMSVLKLAVELERPAPPASDFQFRKGSKTIGLEHTRLFAEAGSGKSTLQARETFLGKIAMAVGTEYERRSLPPIEVKLHIGRAAIGQNQIKPLVHRIVDLIEENLPPEVGRIELSFANVDNFPSEVDSIHMIRFPNQLGRSFVAPHSAWILSIDPAHLQDQIDNKGEKINEYSLSCDEVWLLMVADGTKLSTLVEMPESLWRHSFHFRGFARIFVLAGGAIVHELKSATAS